MSVGFGFSVGDFIAALELVGNIVDALRKSGETGNRYRELVRRLDTLETVLLRVKRLELNESQPAEYVALQQAASQCQRTIDVFWKKIEKYQPALGVNGTSWRVKDGWMKIRWAVCKKDDVNAFRDDISAHTESIQLLLTTLQMSRANLIEKKNDRRSLSLAGQIQNAYFGCMKKLTDVFEATSTGIQQGKQLISTTSKILYVLQMDIQVFQAVLNLQYLITRIPAQVDRQQPVYLVDALGRHSPFHLEFIRSAEALTAVLQANFSKSGQARQKIGRGEFAIQNSLTKRDINIYDDWENCFYPGQRVEMSMVFERRWQTGSSCPGCHMTCEGSTETEVKCPGCDMTFRRIITVEEGQERAADEAVDIVMTEDSDSDSDHSSSSSPSRPMASSFFPAVNARQIVSLPQPHKIQQLAGTRKRKHLMQSNEAGLQLDLHLENIRNVRIQTISRGYTKKFPALFAYFEKGGIPEPAFCWGFRTKEDESCLIIDFDEGESNALCDTIGRQKYKLGGLFHTDLVEAESIIESEEQNRTQITWIEEDDVQLYLRFDTKNHRDTIWKFIVSSQRVWNMRNGKLGEPIASSLTPTIGPSRTEKIEERPIKVSNVVSPQNSQGNIDQPPKATHPAEPSMSECLDDRLRVGLGGSDPLAAGAQLSSPEFDQHVDFDVPASYEGDDLENFDFDSFLNADTNAGYNPSFEDSFMPASHCGDNDERLGLDLDLGVATNDDCSTVFSDPTPKGTESVFFGDRVSSHLSAAEFSETSIDQQQQVLKDSEADRIQTGSMNLRPLSPRTSMISKSLNGAAHPSTPLIMSNSSLGELGQSINRDQEVVLAQESGQMVVPCSSHAHTQATPSNFSYYPPPPTMGLVSPQLPQSPAFAPTSPSYSPASPFYSPASQLVLSSDIVRMEEQEAPLQVPQTPGDFWVLQSEDSRIDMASQNAMSPRIQQQSQQRAQQQAQRQAQQQASSISPNQYWGSKSEFHGMLYGSIPPLQCPATNTMNSPLRLNVPQQIQCNATQGLPVSSNLIIQQQQQRQNMMPQQSRMQMQSQRRSTQRNQAPDAPRPLYNRPTPDSPHHLNVYYKPALTRQHGEAGFTTHNDPQESLMADRVGNETGGGNDALQDHQMPLMLLNQQNKRRLEMGRQEQDAMTSGFNGEGQPVAMGSSVQNSQQAPPTFASRPLYSSTLKQAQTQPQQNQQQQHRQRFDTYQRSGTPSYASHSTQNAPAFSTAPIPETSEDLVKITDAAERRRISNRIALRHYRKKRETLLEDQGEGRVGSSFVPNETFISASVPESVAGDPCVPLFQANTEDGALQQQQQAQSRSMDAVRQKHARNTLAARKSRQRKANQFKIQEDEIAKLEKERDLWKQMATAGPVEEFGQDDTTAPPTGVAEVMMDDSQMLDWLELVGN